jgi:hypothetical protein
MSTGNAAGPRIVHALPGRVRIHLPGWAGENPDAVETPLRQAAGVRHVRADLLTGNILVHFDPKETNATTLLAGVRLIVAQLHDDERPALAAGRPSLGLLTPSAAAEVSRLLPLLGPKVKPPQPAPATGGLVVASGLVSALEVYRRLAGKSGVGIWLEVMKLVLHLGAVLTGALAIRQAHLVVGGAETLLCLGNLFGRRAA